MCVCGLAQACAVYVPAVSDMQGEGEVQATAPLGVGWDAAGGWWVGGLGQHLAGERLGSVVTALATQLNSSNL